MAEVFLAEDQERRVCAIKRILPHLAHQENFIRMFIDEARIVTKLKHRNVAQVLDQGKVDGYYFIAMEFIQGHSLLDLFERAKSMRIVLPLGLLSYIVAEVLAALDCAHNAKDEHGQKLGVVHRDVTPQNILISYGGEVKLIDFGVAKARARLTQTETGFTKGKLSYMSPEQARGETLDGRSDLFSAGIILHEITTNTRMFDKEGPGGILGAIVNEPIPKPSDRSRNYPPDLEAVVMRALKKKVGERWQSAVQMREALLLYAKRERPTPGAARLKEFIHDLFGAPKYSSVIDAGKGVLAPTPAEAKAASLVEGFEGSSPAEDEERNDATRMMQTGVRRGTKKLEITSEGLPAVSAKTPLETSESPHVEEPHQEREAKPERWTQAAAAVRAGFLAHRRRLTRAGLILLALAFLVSASVFVSKTGWVRGWGERAKKMRTRIGLDPNQDGQHKAGPRGLRLRSNPPGAAISIDGIGLGAVTPHDLTDLPAGVPIRLELRLPGYRKHSEELSFKPKQGLRELEFNLVRKSGGVRIVTNPAGARVAIDGAWQPERTPLEVGGLRIDQILRVEVQKPGYVDEQQEVQILDAVVQELMIKLKRDPAARKAGEITIRTTPTGCTVNMDGRALGKSPIDGLLARPGTHRFRVQCPYHRESRRTVRVRAGRSHVLNFKPKPSVFGYLTIQTVPPESTVKVDGKAVRSPVEFLKVVPGHHAVTVSHAGLRQHRKFSVTVGPGARVLRKVNLLQ